MLYDKSICQWPLTWDCAMGVRRLAADLGGAGDHQTTGINGLPTGECGFQSFDTQHKTQCILLFISFWDTLA